MSHHFRPFDLQSNAMTANGRQVRATCDRANLGSAIGKSNTEHAANRASAKNAHFHEPSCSSQAAPSARRTPTLEATKKLLTWPNIPHTLCHGFGQNQATAHAVRS